jgi:hypothetical protein
MQQVVWDLLASWNGLRIAVRLRVAEPAPSRNDRAVANAEAQSGGSSLNEGGANRLLMSTKSNVDRSGRNTVPGDALPMSMLIL